MELTRNLARIGSHTVVFLAALSLSLYAQDNPNTSSSGHSKSVGFVASKDATAKDLGLPLYPGARRLNDDSDSDAAIQVGAWIDSSDFRLVVLKMVSDDSVDKVAAFYRKALAKYGKIVECTSTANDIHIDNVSGDLNCSQDQPEHGGIVLKAGVKKDQHDVAISQKENHTVFQLVYVRTPH
jgi:hypothetical protein